MNIVDHIVKNARPSPNSPLMIRGEGVWVFDNKGRKYLDFCSQTLNLSLGHGHPEILSVAAEQLRQLTYSSSRFLYQPMIDLISRLIKIAPKGLSRVNVKLTNGSDANESAAKRVRKATGKQTIVSFAKAHLGETGETLTMSSKHIDDEYLGGSKNTISFPPPFPEFLPNVSSAKERENISLRKLEQEMEKNNDIAAVIIEPIMVNAGVFIFSPRFLRHLRSICTKHHAVLIFDEIQTAFGWTGSLFLSEGVGVIPDMLTVGKALSPGFPLAAILLKPEFDVLDYGVDEFTGGANPISCAVAVKNIDILTSTSLLKEVKQKEPWIKDRLDMLVSDIPEVSETRGLGMIWGVSFDSNKMNGPEMARRVCQQCLDRGLIVRVGEDGKGNNIILKPPLVTTQEELELGFQLFEQVIDDVVCKK